MRLKILFLSMCPIALYAQKMRNPFAWVGNGEKNEFSWRVASVCMGDKPHAILTQGKKSLIVRERDTVGNGWFVETILEREVLFSDGKRHHQACL